MLGAIAGDIIGSPFEWNNTDDRYFELCHSTRGWYRGREVSYHPKFTDDTVMTLAVARWLMQDPSHSSSRLVRTMQEMCRQYADRGFGPMFRRWIDSDDPHPANSFGNGCAVRVSPIALVAESLPDAIALARQTAEISHVHPEGVKGAEAMAQAVWMARHGRSKDDIRFAMENDFGYSLSPDIEEFRQVLQGCEKVPIVVNGEDTGGYWFRPTGRMNSSCQDTVPAALIAFIQGDSFEDVIRRAVALGGDSDSIAAMAGAIAEPFYGGVPEKIRGLCEVYLTPDLRSGMETFERVMVRKEVRTGKVEKEPDDAFRMVRIGDARPIYIVSAYRKDIIEALRAKFGEDVIIMGPQKAREHIAEAMPNKGRSGTYLEEPRIDERVIYYRDGTFHSPTSYPFRNAASADIRARVFSDFQQMKEYARDVKSRLQAQSGYYGEGSVHFETAYFPVILHSSIEVWKGDTFAGSIGIDPLSGLLKTEDGGDLGPAEWGEDRCFSVFCGTGMEAFKEALSHFCLDEGVGIEGRDYKTNLERANDDMGRCSDMSLAAPSGTEEKSKSVRM